MRYGTVALLIAITWGCASSERSTTVDVRALPTPVVDISRYENFDPAPYPDAPLDTLATVTHDVPAQLMEGRAAEGLRSEVPGFRVQIFSSIERNAAMGAQENVQAWWRKQHDEGTVPEEIFPRGSLSTTYTASRITAFASGTFCRAMRPRCCTVSLSNILPTRLSYRTRSLLPGSTQHGHGRDIVSSGIRCPKR